MWKIIKNTPRLFGRLPRVNSMMSQVPIYYYMPSRLFFNKNMFFFSASEDAHKNISKSSFEGPGFYMEQLLTGCLSIYSYYIESNGEAFLIDPMNQIQKYEAILRERKTKLKGVFLSHYHADYIAGHMQFQKKFKCDVYMGPKSLGNLGLTVLSDNYEIKVGQILLKVIHTPGHTEESSCLMLIDSKKNKQALFTGDTMFINEVGRPDLAVKTELTREDLAGMLYDSIQKIKKLEGDIRIYPGHGAGSSCGKHIGKGDFCMLNTQKQNNYALKAENKQQFIDNVLQDMPSPPQYFGHDANINKYAPFDYQEIQNVVMTKIPSSNISRLIKRDHATIIDVRSQQQLKNGMIEGAIAIDFNGPFASWTGTVMSPKDYYIVYGPKQIATQSIKRMLRIGYTNIAGYCSDSLEEMGKILKIYKPDFVYDPKQDDHDILDVRKPGQYKSGHAQKSIHIQLSKLFDEYQNLDKNKKYMVHCQSGYRARIAYSFLKSKGFKVKAFVDKFQQIGKKGVKITH